MTRLRRAVPLLAFSFAVFGAFHSVRAAGYGGVLEAVVAARKEIVVLVGDAQEVRTFQVNALTDIALDGRRAAMSDLPRGAAISVQVHADGYARTIVARTSPDYKGGEPRPFRTGSTVRAERVLPRGGAPRPQPPIASAPNAAPAARPTSQGPAGTVPEGPAHWPQFGGPKRDNHSPDRGLLASWPEGGPKLLGRALGVGEGYSSVAIAHGLLFTMGNFGADEMVVACDLSNGRRVWTVRSGSAYRESQGDGPRSTPTVDGEFVYALGAQGDLVCIDVRTGLEAWRKNVLADFHGRNIQWGLSESVLIDGDRLICTPGGNRATMVALDKRTGDVRWTGLAPGEPPADNSSAIVVETGGVRQAVNFTGRSLVSFRIDDGTFLWEDRTSANGTANCASPVAWGDAVFASSGYGAGASLLRLTTEGNATRSTLAYHTDEMRNHHGGLVVADGHVYGTSDPGVLTCLDVRTGDVKWKNRSVGKGSIACAEGRLYVRGENGQVALVEANAGEYRETGRFDQPHRSGRPAWPHTVIADRKLFLRDQDVVLCFDLRAN